MIVAPQPEAVEAGTDVLRVGGSAVDAVVACALMQGVVDPMMCGIGGLGVLQLFDPASGQHRVLSALSTCPAAAGEDMWAASFIGECGDGYGYAIQGAGNELGHAAVTTPGILRLYSKVHEEFGRLSWRSLFGAAIAAAESGWIVRPRVASYFALDERPFGRRPVLEKLALTEGGRRLYLRADGSPKLTGDVVVNPDLAMTLKSIAEEGPDVFYRGWIADRMVADMERNGGLMSKADLGRIAPTWEEPLIVSYRGRRVAAPAPPAGGVVVGQILRILERFDVVNLEHNSAEYIRVVCEAMKMAVRDRERYIADPDFVVPPIGKLLSDAYADSCAGEIRAGLKASPGVTGNWGAKNTTTVSCVDANGLVVSMTHTLGTPSGVVPPGTGFTLNGAMNWYDPRPGRASSIAPNKRRFSPMSPSIVFEDDKPVATLGAPGGAWIGVAILQTLLNLFDWGMTMQEAVSAPRFSATTDKIDLSNRIPHAVERELKAMGYETRRFPESYAFAAVHGITLYEGRLEGGADPRLDGCAGGIP
jgi:gamma-glutamyltranspeptidase/glutathione hydrolase